MYFKLLWGSETEERTGLGPNKAGYTLGDFETNICINIHTKILFTFDDWWIVI